MVQIGLELSLKESAAFFGLVDPFSVGVTDAEANVDQVSVVLDLTSRQVDQLHVDFEVSVLVESIGQLIG